MIRKLALLTVFAGAAFANAEILFSDNFESGTFGSWTRVGTTTTQIATISNAQSVSPTQSAFFPAGAAASGNVTDRYITNLSRPESVGNEILRFSFYMYDSNGGGGGRMYIELRSYSGDLYNSGTLEQLYAAGKFNAVTAPGETYNGGRYQGRGAFGVWTGSTGWFNYDNTTPRSIGWHRHEIQVNPDSVYWFIDGALAKQTARGANGSLDCIVMGSNVSSDTHDAYYDNVKMQAFPFEFHPVSYEIVEGVPFGGNLDSLQLSDNDSLFILNDEANVNTTVNFPIYISSATPSSFMGTVETGATRNDMSVFIKMFNVNTTAYQTVSSAVSSLTEVVYNFSPTTPTDFIDPTTKKVDVQLQFIPFQDLEAADGWSESVDQVKITAAP